MDKINKVIIRGTIISYPELFFMTMKDEYYRIDVEVKRLSGDSDIIPVVIPRKFIDPSADYKNMRINLEGQVQTRRDLDGHLFLYIYTKNAQIYNLFDEDELDINEVNFTGVLKNKLIRKTSKRNIDIADVFFLNKNYYYPCIIWNENVSKIRNMNKNTKILAKARFQSRPYTCELNGVSNNKIAYELSISQLEAI